MKTSSRVLRVCLLQSHLLVGLVMLNTLAASDSPLEKGLAIATEADRRNSGWGDCQVSVSMVLRNSHGEESFREMRMQFLEGKSEGDKSLVVFDTPKDVKGTVLLTHAHKKAHDDQWLYLPALNRIKRVSSSNQSGPFMGSEFAYEDLSAPELEKFSYRYLHEEQFESQHCFVIERTPATRNSGYSRQVVWMDTEAYRVQKVDYYDRKGALLKTLTAKAYRQYRGGYWRADELSMVNHQTRKTTVLLWRDVVFGKGLTDRDFDHNSLARAR